MSSETPVARPYTQSPFVRQTDSLDDERHERAGSVKFADQAEENKEVLFASAPFSISSRAFLPDTLELLATSQHATSEGFALLAKQDGEETPHGEQRGAV